MYSVQHTEPVTTKDIERLSIVFSPLYIVLVEKISIISPTFPWTALNTWSWSSYALQVVPGHQADALYRRPHEIGGGSSGQEEAQQEEPG